MAPVKCKKVEIEKLRRIKKESEQKRRDKIRNDPILYEEAKKRERERYHKRKAEGKIKNISQLSAREKRVRRQKWVKKNKKISLEQEKSRGTIRINYYKYSTRQ